MPVNVKNIITILSAVFMLSYTTSTMAWEAFGFGVRESTASSLCNNDADHEFDDGASRWTGEMDDHWATATYDTMVQGVEFCDVNITSGCHDHDASNVDHGDASIIATHGFWSDSNTIYNIKMSNTTANKCRPGASGAGLCWASTNHWQTGDNDVEMVSTYACSSGTIGRGPRIRGWSSRLHQWHGMHGSGSTGQDNWTDDFADDAVDGVKHIKQIAGI